MRVQNLLVHDQSGLYYQRIRWQQTIYKDKKQDGKNDSATLPVPQNKPLDNHIMELMQGRGVNEIFQFDFMI